ncbi:MAG: ATP-binding protein [Gemmatimonadaceae bacterium]|nr:ATP-binding protein [Gemmatimonadaceae bacterium]
MTAVITVPSSLNDLSFEQVLDQMAEQPTDARVIVDARHCTFASPYGLTALLTLAQTRTAKPTLLPPEDQDKSSYWARVGFFAHAEDLYDIQGAVPRQRAPKESGYLLEITPIVKSDDVHTVVERIRDKATEILTEKLHLVSRATMGFTMTLSEACQNIVEHAGRGGWLAVQVYKYRERLHGRLAVVIAVCDAGVGFRRSLESSPRRPLTDRWDDRIALEAAVINGVSRFPEAGRGQGLKGIRGYVHRWEGKLSVRSGTARVAVVPKWDDDLALRENLAPFPGAQLQITIPEKVA